MGTTTRRAAGTDARTWPLTLRDVLVGVYASGWKRGAAAATLGGTREVRPTDEWLRLIAAEVCRRYGLDPARLDEVIGRNPRPGGRVEV